MNTKFDIRDIILNDMNLAGENFPLGFLIGTTVNITDLDTAVIIEADPITKICVLIVNSDKCVIKAYVTELLSEKSNWQFDISKLEQTYRSFQLMIAEYTHEVYIAECDLLCYKDSLEEIKRRGGCVSHYETNHSNDRFKTISGSC